MKALTNCYLQQPLKNRPGSIIQCKPEILNYDEFLQAEVSKDVGCIPPFWKISPVEELELKQCTSTYEIKHAFNYVKDVHKKLSPYDSPCNDMFNSVRYNWRQSYNDGNPGKSIIKFEYKENYYQEIEYVQDFGFESFWSGVGGFVGIFLGYPLMQLPTFLGKVTNQDSQSIGI